PIGSLGGHWAHNWDDVSYGAALKLAQITKDPAYVAAVEANLDWWQPGGLTYTPGGLAWLNQWGSLRYATTQAFLAFVYANDAITEYFTRGWIVYEDAYGLNVLFQVDNRSSWPPTVKTDMSTRYFMDFTELFNAGFTVNDVVISLQQSEGATLSTLKQWSGNI